MKVDNQKKCEETLKKLEANEQYRDIGDICYVCCEKEAMDGESMCWGCFERMEASYADNCEWEEDE